MIGIRKWLLWGVGRGKDFPGVMEIFIAFFRR